MDLEDEGWVNIPYDELLETHDDGDEKMISGKHIKNPMKLFKPNHFTATPKSQDFDHEDEAKETINNKPKTTLEQEPESESDQDQDQDPIFQVFLKKENQFVEMKPGSPRLNSQETDLFRIETGSLHYGEKGDDHAVNSSSPSKMIKQEVVVWEENNQRSNFWGWGKKGIGAFCSLGMAAATICIIILGNGRKCKQQNQKLRIQVYSDNKRIKQAMQQAKEAMSGMRGVPLVKAQITYGGCSEGL